MAQRKRGTAKPWQGSTRKYRLPPDWPQRRAAVIARDHGTCQMPQADRLPCGAPGTDVDHIQRGDNHDLANLWLLCRACHTTKTQAEAAAARVRLYRTPERHPGDI